MALFDGASHLSKLHRPAQPLHGPLFSCAQNFGIIGNGRQYVLEVRACLRAGVRALALLCCAALLLLLGCAPLLQQKAAPHCTMPLCTAAANFLHSCARMLTLIHLAHRWHLVQMGPEGIVEWRVFDTMDGL